MAENDKDSGSPAGTSDATNAAGSQGQNVQPGSIDAAKVLSALEALDKKLAEVDARSRSLQGDKDRAVTKTSNEVEELKRQIAEVKKLEKAGLEPDAAVEEFSFREDIRQIKSLLQKNSVSDQAPGKGASGANDVATVISDLKLDPNDAGVLKILQDTSDPVMRAAKLGAYSSQGKQPPDASAAPSLQSGAVQVGQADRNKLKSDYLSEVQKLRGNKPAIKLLQEQYKKKGLDVQNIGFGV